MRWATWVVRGDTTLKFLVPEGEGGGGAADEGIENNYVKKNKSIQAKAVM